ncbi:MAG: hypothetical protein PVJ67_06470 [Candidatus Pacearchaeota archaeon]|jgi:hypothetical protein
MQKILEKKRLEEFINSLMKKYEVIAPVKKGNHAKFEKIKNAKEIYLDKITNVPIKEFFISENQIVLEFKKNKVIEPEIKDKKRIIFGLRKCDLNAITLFFIFINKNNKTELINLIV